MAFVLLFSFSTTALADELPQEESHDLVSVIAVADVNGNYVQYELYDNTVTEIPIYAVKEGQPTRDLEAVATLTIGLNDNQAVFIFTSINVVIATITKGFTGEIVTFFSGIRYGYIVMKMYCLALLLLEQLVQVDFQGHIVWRDMIP